MFLELLTLAFITVDKNVPVAYTKREPGIADKTGHVIT
jgi:hypothetical protein